MSQYFATPNRTLQFASKRRHVCLQRNQNSIFDVDLSLEFKIYIKSDVDESIFCQVHPSRTHFYLSRLFYGVEIFKTSKFGVKDFSTILAGSLSIPKCQVESICKNLAVFKIHFKQVHPRPRFLSSKNLFGRLLSRLIFRFFSLFIFRRFNVLAILDLGVESASGMAGFGNNKSG